MDIIVSDNSHHSSLRQFCMSAGRAVLTAVLLSHESGSNQSRSKYCSKHYVLKDRPYLKEVPKISSSSSQTCVHCTANFIS